MAGWCVAILKSFAAFASRSHRGAPIPRSELARLARQWLRTNDVGRSPRGLKSFVVTGTVGQHVAKAQGPAAEARHLTDELWDPVFSRATGPPRRFWTLALGVSSRRVKEAQGTAKAAVDGHYVKRGTAGVAPANKTPDTTQRRISRVLVTFTKTVPDPSGLQKNCLQFTDSDVNSRTELRGKAFFTHEITQDAWLDAATGTPEFEGHLLELLPRAMKDAAANLAPVQPPSPPRCGRSSRRCSESRASVEPRRTPRRPVHAPPHAHARISNELSTPSCTTVGLKGCPVDIAARVNFGLLVTSAACAAGPGGLAHGT